jgi:hypothetical protein
VKPSAVGCSRWDEGALIDLEEGTARTEVVDIRYGAALTNGFPVGAGGLEPPTARL